MNSMEEDLLKLEMEQTLKQAEEALREIRRDTEPEKRHGQLNLRRRPQNCLPGACLF